MGLAGIMFWAPDLDDFTGGLCNQGKYPLMTTAVNLIRGQTVWSTSTKSSTTSSTTTTIQTKFEEQKRVVCYYTKYVNMIDHSGKKRDFFWHLVGHNIVRMEENSFQKILMLPYVHISFMHLLY